MSKVSNQGRAKFYRLLANFYETDVANDLLLKGFSEQQLHNFIEMAADYFDLDDKHGINFRDLSFFLIELRSFLSNENSLQKGDLLSTLKDAFDKGDLKDIERILSDNKSVSDRLIFLLGKLYLAFSDINRAHQQFTLALQKNEKDWEYLESASETAWKTGDAELAYEYDIRKLQIAESKKDQKLISESCNDIAVSLKQLHKFDEALRYYEKSIEIDEELFGTDSIEVAVTLSNISVVLSEINEIDRAIACAEKAVKIGEKNLSQSDKRLLAWKSTLAGTLYLAGNIEDAIAMMKSVLQLTEEKYPSDYSVNARRLINYSKMVETQGNYNEALDLLLRALSLSEKYHGQNAIPTRTVLNRLGKIYDNLGRSDSALDVLNKALEISKANEKTDLAYAATLNNISVVLASRGNYDDAISYMDHALGLRSELLGAEHPLTIASRENFELMKTAETQN